MSLADVFRSVIFDHGKLLLREFVLGARTTLRQPVNEILDAVAEVSEEALDDVLNILLSQIARRMTAAEIVEAQKVYGRTLDYGKIYFSRAGLTNDLIFGIQDWFRGRPDSRAFVTMKLVNFDVSDGPLSNPVMIHELCHVYQYQDIGPIYAAEAIHAQLKEELTGVSAYNYGFNNRSNGEGGEVSLLNAINNNPLLSQKEVFEIFNREQQAMIIQHYYVRRYVERRPEADYAAWQPIQEVHYTA
ncbi:MAG: hypothetical protein ACFBSC_14875 [Microcoleaceae cyanobacterium]